MTTQKSAFDTPWFNSQDQSFFNQLNKTKIPHIVLTAETEDFDDEIAKQWAQEGFDTAYVALLNGGSDYIKRVHTTGDSFGVGEYYAIVAYGEAASTILEAHLKPNNPRLCAIVAYYPSAIPTITTRFPPSIKVLVHLAGTEVGVTRNSEVLGIQGKRKTVQKRIDKGAGTGGSLLKFGFQAYTYAGSEPGFAEHDLDEFDPIAESVAFSRSLATLQKGFRIESRVEEVRDDFTDAVVRGGEGKNMDKFLRPGAKVLYAPTLAGGSAAGDIRRFYAEFFHPLPPSYSSRLISRTIGTDRVVDEVFLSLTHSQPIEWLLPGVPATNRKIEIVVVSILCARGGKLESEHVYWDQASVLAQIGLLDPKLAVPAAWKKHGVKRLPIVGAEASRAMRGGPLRAVNSLIERWQNLNSKS